MKKFNRRHIYILDIFKSRRLNQLMSVASMYGTESGIDPYPEIVRQ